MTSLKMSKMNMMNNKYYKKLPLKGRRHLVFGDIHGRFDDMMLLLHHVGYEPDQDVLYTVGDMVDRGPNSMDVVRFFTEHENRHTIMGNHEWMILQPEYTNVWLGNGGYEFHREMISKHYDVPWVIERIKDLPYVLDVGEIGTPGSFRLVHAEIPVGHDERLFQMEMEEQDETFLNGLLWSRKEIEIVQEAQTVPSQEATQKLMELASGLKNRQPMDTIVGHSWVKEPVSVGTRTYIDCGMNNLTLYDVGTKDWYSYQEVKLEYGL